jgi:hypothetical protein
MMNITHMTPTNRVQQLRQDPDFRALVELLRNQPRERVGLLLPEGGERMHVDEGVAGGESRQEEEREAEHAD